MRHNVGTATHISPDCRSTLSQGHGVESSDCREIWCCKVAKSCGCELLMGRALYPMWCKIPTFFAFNCSTDAILAKWCEVCVVLCSGRGRDTVSLVTRGNSVFVAAKRVLKRGQPGNDVVLRKTLCCEAQPHLPDKKGKAGRKRVTCHNGRSSVATSFAHAPNQR